MKLLSEEELVTYIWVLITLGSIFVLLVLRFAYYFFKLNLKVRKLLGNKFYFMWPTKEGKKEIKKIVYNTPSLAHIAKKAYQSWKYGLIYMILIFAPIFAYFYISVASLKN